MVGLRATTLKPGRRSKIKERGWLTAMAANRVKAKVKELRAAVESLGVAIAFRKMHGILNALEMQVEDGHYQRHAVARLCEALLATRELYDIPEGVEAQLEELACSVIDLVEKRR
jgi:hypothetical protein